VTPGSPWAVRAAALYDDAGAKRYRAHDDEFEASGPCRQFAEWLRRVCGAFDSPIDVLDLGCGTGRYFWALTGVRSLVGLDASPAMIAEARQPYRAGAIAAQSLSLVEADLFTHAFLPRQFDLIYSIGVLAEHVPLDEEVVGRVSTWLKPQGRFAFTTVHPQSPSVHRTVWRRLGERVSAIAVGAPGRMLRRRLLADGMYADERRVRALLEGAFDIEMLERFQSEAHVHCLCVARKTRA
jgi:SAM-dependent methyltransferase